MRQSISVVGPIRMAVLAVVVASVYPGFVPGRTAASRNSAQASKTNSATAAEESQIRELLAEQAAAWNRGDIDSFMTSYWKSDQTLFVGATGIARGWQAVLDRYHRAYPDRKAMGHVAFSNLEVHVRCADTAFVLGNYHLDRENDHPEGVFTLDLQKFPDGWRIVVDHTTAFAAQPAKSQ
jgi:ketosteroid isomerase-like protein